MSRKLVLPFALLCWLFSAWAHADTATEFHEKADAILSDIDQATWVTQGKGNRVLYIFFDPNCPYCHKLYDRLQPMIKPHHLRIHWIPVGLLTESSLPKAAAMLQAKDPLAAFQHSENNYDMGLDGPGGAISPAKQIQNKTRLALAENLGLLQQQNISVVPLVVFRATGIGGFMFEGAPPEGPLRQLLDAVQTEARK